MYKFLVKTKDKDKIFIYRPYDGICEITLRAGRMTEPQCICREGSEVFFVYKDNQEVIHLITASKNNQFVYMCCKEGKWNKYIICGINESMEIKNVMIGLSDIGQNFFYSALYHQEYILVHCVLGNHAMPSTIDRMSCENFFVYKNRVYYSNGDGILGYSNFSDGKPDSFVKLMRGKMPYIFNCRNEEYFVYKDEDRIYVNGEECANDAGAENPILVKNRESMMLMWKNGDFVKYLPYEQKYFNTKPMQYISNGIIPSVYIYSDGIRCREYMGISSNNSLKFFADDPFALDAEYIKEREFLKKQAEILNLKTQIELLRKEISDYRKQIRNLNIIIRTGENVSGKNINNESIKE